ncbi:MAG: YraN family protein [Verrucomicrobia bacterium]|nr:YraN family protein [Verrucomicrobiota bacterium]
MRALWAKIRQFWAGNPTPERARIGSAGERAAEAHLRAAGLRVLARNWRNPADTREELDLVCQDREVLVFVEVKTRAAGARVSGYHAVNTRKKKVLLRVCRAYLARLRPPAKSYRFDIVEVAHDVDPATAAGMQAMALETHLASTARDGSLVWHYRDVPLFPNRTNHRHE